MQAFALSSSETCIAADLLKSESEANATAWGCLGGRSLTLRQSKVPIATIVRQQVDKSLCTYKAYLLEFLTTPFRTLLLRGQGEPREMHICVIAAKNTLQTSCTDCSQISHFLRSITSGTCSDKPDTRRHPKRTDTCSDESETRTHPSQPYTNLKSQKQCLRPLQPRAVVDRACAERSGSQSSTGGFYICSSNLIGLSWALLEFQTQGAPNMWARHSRLLPYKDSNTKLPSGVDPGMSVASQHYRPAAILAEAKRSNQRLETNH